MKKERLLAQAIFIDELNFGEKLRDAGPMLRSRVVMLASRRSDPPVVKLQPEHYLLAPCSTWVFRAAHLLQHSIRAS